MIKKILSKCIYYLTFILPKKKWAVLQSFPTWEDSCIVMYKYLLQTNVEKIIWLVPERTLKSPIQIDFNRTTIVKRNSIKGVFYYSLSKYVFLTHGLYFRNFPKNQISINIWHGMPIKRIGLLNNGLPLRTTFALSTSDFFKNTIKLSFGIPEKSILSIGLPRNENLFVNRKKIKDALSIDKNKKVVLWLPTYRKSVIGEIRQDGGVFDNPFNLWDFNQNKFNEFLKKNDVLCLFKIHPMADVGGFKSSSNLWIIDDNFLYDKNLTLYQILGISEFMITDISSIVVDYLLLDKPIILSFPDKEVYLNTRGLNTIEILENPPGKICGSQEEIMKEMELLLAGIDAYSENRSLLRQLYHGKTDYLNCGHSLLKEIGLGLSQ